MNYESFLECLYDMEFNPNQLEHKEEIKTQNLKGTDAIILEMIMEDYMRIIERNTGKVITKHPKQRKLINLEGVKTNE